MYSVTPRFMSAISCFVKVALRSGCESLSSSSAHVSQSNSSLSFFSRRNVSSETPLTSMVAMVEYLDYLEQNLGQNILVTEAAERASISVDTLERLTREVFHLTPKQLLMKLRIDHACKLLETTDNSITDIATDCGYADHSAFTRQFKSATHLTPRQYRNARGRGLHPH